MPSQPCELWSDPSLLHTAKGMQAAGQPGAALPHQVGNNFTVLCATSSPKRVPTTPTQHHTLRITTVHGHSLVGHHHWDITNQDNSKKHPKGTAPLQLSTMNLPQQHNLDALHHQQETTTIHVVMQQRSTPTDHSRYEHSFTLLHLTLQQEHTVQDSPALLLQEITANSKGTPSGNSQYGGKSL